MDLTDPDPQHWSRVMDIIFGGLKFNQYRSFLDGLQYFESLSL
jgi:hypothetical protein